MSVKSMTEERLLLLLSASELQLQTVKSALADLSTKSITQNTAHHEHTNRLEMYCLRLEGLIEHSKTASERLFRHLAYLAIALALFTVIWLLMAYFILLTNL